MDKPKRFDQNNELYGSGSIHARSQQQIITLLWFYLFAAYRDLSLNDIETIEKDFFQSMPHLGFLYVIFTILFMEPIAFGFAPL